MVLTPSVGRTSRQQVVGQTINGVEVIPEGDYTFRKYYTYENGKQKVVKRDSIKDFGESAYMY